MFTRDKIAECIIREKEQSVVDDWAHVSFDMDCSSANIPYSPVEVVYKFDIRTAITINHNDSSQLIEHKKREAANCMFHYLYGDLLSRFQLLAHRINYTSRKEADDCLKNIIKELKGER